MVIIHQVAESIFQINTQVGTPAPTMVYFIADDKPSLVDPGPGSAFPAILEALRKLGHDVETISYIFLTHVHVDHAGGAGYLAQRASGAKVVVHPKGAPHLVDPSKLISSTKGVFGPDFEREFGPILAVPQHQIRTLQDEEVVSLGQRKLGAIYSPGHASHHMCLYDSKSRGLFCGEAVGTPLPGVNLVLPSVSPPSFALDLYLETLAKLRKIAPSILFFPHSEPTREVDKHFQLAYETLVAAAGIISEATKAGQNPGQIAAALQAYAPQSLLTLFGPISETFVAEFVNYLRTRDMSHIGDR